MEKVVSDKSIVKFNYSTHQIDAFVLSNHLLQTTFILNEILKRTPGLNDVKLVVDATETGSFQIVYNLIETVSGGEIGPACQLFNRYRAEKIYFKWNIRTRGFFLLNYVKLLEETK